MLKHQNRSNLFSHTIGENPADTRCPVISVSWKAGQWPAFVHIGSGYCQTPPLPPSLVGALWAQTTLHPCSKCTFPSCAYFRGKRTVYLQDVNSRSASCNWWPRINCTVLNCTLLKKHSINFILKYETPEKTPKNNGDIIDINLNCILKWHTSHEITHIC